MSFESETEVENFGTFRPAVGGRVASSGACVRHRNALWNESIIVSRRVTDLAQAFRVC